jgi:hypothetical protein
MTKKCDGDVAFFCLIDYILKKRYLLRVRLFGADKFTINVSSPAFNEVKVGDAVLVCARIENGRIANVYSVCRVTEQKDIALVKEALGVIESSDNVLADLYKKIIRGN